MDKKGIHDVDAPPGEESAAAGLAGGALLPAPSPILKAAQGADGGKSDASVCGRSNESAARPPLSTIALYEAAIPRRQLARDAPRKCVSTVAHQIIVEVLAHRHEQPRVDAELYGALLKRSRSGHSRIVTIDGDVKSLGQGRDPEGAEMRS